MKGSNKMDAVAKTSRRALALMAAAGLATTHSGPLARCGTKASTNALTLPAADAPNKKGGKQTLTRVPV